MHDLRTVGKVGLLTIAAIAAVVMVWVFPKTTKSWVEAFDQWLHDAGDPDLEK
jgi:hypothetical protein